ncbi:MAG: T9SS type B sorting domain-containing protein [Bacteroidota bacterium]
MRLGKYIALSGLLLMLWGLVAGAQDRQWTVCAGDTGIAYYVEGWETSTFDWTVEGGTITRNFGDSIIVDWPMEKGAYVITVLETSEYGCSGELRTGTVQVVGPDIELGQDDYVCEGELFEITPEGDFSSYLWNDGSTGPLYSTFQEGWISVEVTDGYGCALSDSIYLTVNDLPVVALGSDTSICDAEGLVLDAGPDGTSYTWSTGDIGQEITVVPGGRQEIGVVVENQYGCTSADTIVINPCDVEFFFRDIPTAITPNGDGANDTWSITKLTGYPQAEVEIFSRWGTLIWKSEPGYPGDGWDGKDMNGNEMPMDSYHFVIKLNVGDKDRITGIITVIR